MKFFLVSMVCLVGAVLAQPRDTRQKRDVLPGDPRYHGYHVDHPPNDVPYPANAYVPVPPPRPVPVPAPPSVYIPQEDPEDAVYGIDIRLGGPVHGGSYGGSHGGYVY